MLDAIIYNSRCGFTKVYAEAIAKKLNLPLLNLKEAKKNLKKGSEIMFCSWVKENKIVKYDKLTRYSLKAIVAVGIKGDSEEVRQNISYENQLTTKLFYLRGGINKKKLSLRQKFILHSIESNMSFKLLDSGLTKDDALTLEAIMKNLDYTNLATIAPIITYFDKDLSDSSVS